MVDVKVINKTTPLNVQSIAIPLEEFDRLGDRFENFEADRVSKPSIIILNNNKILMQSKISKINYSECINLSTENIKIYVLSKLVELCKEEF